MKLPYRKYLTTELATQLRQLSVDQVPNFGLMTPQHMIEHLTWTTKMFSRQKGIPGTEAPSKSALGFQRFVAKGCPFEHRPKKGVTSADLPELKYSSMEEAIQELEKAITAFYSNGDTDPNYKSYHPSVGVFDMEQQDLIIGRHAKWHAYQFGLVETF